MTRPTTHTGRRFPLALRVAILALALALPASACGRYLEAAAAVVDGRSIPMDELERRVRAALPNAERATAQQVLEAQRRELSQMIQDRIIESEAAKRKISVPAGQVEQRFQQIRGQFQSEEQFNEALAQQGVNPATVRDRIRLRLIVEGIQKSLADAVRISDADVRTAYGDGRRFEEARVRHILVAVQNPQDAAAALREARAALAEIRGGADFAAVARRISDDPGSKAQGGVLGTIQRGQTVPEFERAAFSLKPGQISEPVQTQFGYHIIQTQAIGKKTLKQAAPGIRQQLQQERAQAAFQDFLSTRVEAADVRVNPRFGRFDAESLAIVERQFFTPASRAPVPEGIPGLQLPPPDAPPADAPPADAPPADAPAAEPTPAG